MLRSESIPPRKDIGELNYKFTNSIISLMTLLFQINSKYHESYILHAD